MTEAMTSPRPLEAPKPQPILRHDCSLWADPSPFVSAIFYHSVCLFVFCPAPWLFPDAIFLLPRAWSCTLCHGAHRLVGYSVILRPTIYSIDLRAP